VYEIVFTKQAAKSLRRIPPIIANSIRGKLAQIALDPFAKHVNVTKLQNRPSYRLRVGDWRVIYEINTEQFVVMVLKIAKRGEVYR
jgi:mRNA interferase RelE/StbE